MTERTCTVEGCGRKFLARGFCGSHYATWFRKNRPKQKTCTECGASFSADRPSTNVCSKACVAQIKARSPKWLAHVEAVGVAKANRPPREPTSPKPRGDNRGPLRKAVEADDRPGIVQALRARTQTDAFGCWLWSGKTSDGYGVAGVRIDGKRRDIAVHRLMAYAVHASNPDEPVVHHKCAQRRCCNPDHITPATQRDNVAEMLARNYYEQRITDLESALAGIAPEHPVLRPTMMTFLNPGTTPRGPLTGSLPA